MMEMELLGGDVSAIGGGDTFYSHANGPDVKRMDDIYEAIRARSHPNRFCRCFMSSMQDEYMAAGREKNAKRLKYFFVASAFFFLTSAFFHYVYRKDDEVYAAFLLGACLTLVAFSFMYVQVFVDFILMHQTPMFVFSVLTLLSVCFMIVIIATVEQDHSPPVNMMLIIFACYGFSVRPWFQLTLIMFSASICWHIYLVYLGSVHRTHLYASFFALWIPNIFGSIYGYKMEDFSRCEFSVDMQLQAALSNNERSKERYGQFLHAIVPPFVEPQQPKEQRIIVYRGATVCVLRVHDPSSHVALQTDPEHVRSFFAALLEGIEEACEKHGVCLAQIHGEHFVFVGNVPSSAQVGHSNMFRAISEIVQVVRDVFMCTIHTTPTCRVGIGSGEISVGFVGGEKRHLSFAIAGSAVENAYTVLNDAVMYTGERSGSDDTCSQSATTTTTTAAASSTKLPRNNNPFDTPSDDELRFHSHDPWSPFALGAPITNDVFGIDAGVRAAIKEMCSQRTNSQVDTHMHLAGREHALQPPTFIVTQHHSLVCIMDDCNISLIHGHVSYTPRAPPVGVARNSDSFLDFNDPGVIQAVQNRFGRNTDESDDSIPVRQAREPLHVMDATDMDALLGNMMKARVPMETRSFLSAISPFFSRVHTINLGNGKLRRLTLDDVCSDMRRFWRLYRMRYGCTTFLWFVLGCLMLFAFGVLDIVVFLKPVRMILILRFGVAPAVFVLFGIVYGYCRIRPFSTITLWRTTQVLWLIWTYIFVFALYIVAPAEDTLYGGPRLVAAAIYITLFTLVPFTSFLRYIVWIPIVSFSVLRIAYAATKERQAWLAVDTSPALIFQLIATTVMMFMISYVNTNDMERFFVKFVLYGEVEKSLFAIQTQLRQLLELHFPRRFVECIATFHDRKNEVFCFDHAAVLQIFVNCASLTDQMESARRIDEFIQESPYEKLTYSNMVYTLVYEGGKKVETPAEAQAAHAAAERLFEGVYSVRKHRHTYGNRHGVAQTQTLSCRAGFAVGTVFLCLLGDKTKNVVVRGSAADGAHVAWAVETESQLFPETMTF